MAQFYREFVVPNKPCIITGDSLPNLGQRWTDEYLLRTVGHHTVRIWCGPGSQCGGVLTCGGNGRRSLLM